MKKFKAFVIKEFIHIWRDKRTLTILLSMPAILIIIFGFAITNEINDAPIGIYDKSKDELTSKISSTLLNSGYFKLESVIKSDYDINEVFKKGRIKMIIIFESDFESNLTKFNTANVQIISDATDPNVSNTLVNYAQALIRNFIANEYNINPKFRIDVKMRYNPEMKGSFLFVPGLITILMMLIGAMMTALSLARERETGSMEYLLTTPLNSYIIIFAKLIPYLLIAIFDICIILILGTVVFGVIIQGNIYLLMFECLLFIIMSLSLGLLISTLAKSQQIALMVSLMGLMLPTILLSDFIFPVSNMPVWLQIFSNVIPARWFNIIIKSVMLKGAGISNVFIETLYICGFIVLFLGLSLLNFKQRLN